MTKLINLDELKEAILKESGHHCNGCNSNCAACDDSDKYIQLSDLFEILDKFDFKTGKFTFR